ncbi:hypothetical protein BDZ97DRAFT_1760892 [Flammula alnicola]|nr:hypothetical protein BDZ97DRAFT_1760892 [Flammula alnicola]
MRIRIQTHSPLPEIKAWFVPDVHNLPDTIYDLKEALCWRVQALKDGQYHGQNLILLLEDFELLNDSPFSAVRDGDLICIKQSSSPKVADMEMGVELEQPRERKRKRSQTASTSIPKATPLSSLPARAPAVLPPSKKRTLKQPEPSSESGSESDTSSSSSSSSSASGSSSSSASSSSSSSSGSSSPPKSLPSKKPAAKASTIPKSVPDVIHVPPGLGKPSTHSRNKRRRKKREYEKGITSTPTPVPPKGSSEANSLPLGAGKQRSLAPASAANVNPASVPLPASPGISTSAPPTVIASSSASRKDARVSIDGEGGEASSSKPSPAPVYITQDQVMMGSMRNKNKKKGFKLSMSNPIPQKIIFGEEPATTVPAEQSNRNANANEHDMQMQVDSESFTYASSSSFVGTSTPVPYVRLIPPSEIQERGELPPNMFVTSVDVEAGMWDDYTTTISKNNNNGSNNSNGKASKSKKRGKKKKTDDEDYYAQDESWYAETQEDDVGLDASVMLDYSESTDANAASAASGELDWDQAERQWDSSTVITSADQLSAGALVGWKGLAINPRTFSPEVLLNIAKVANFSEAASDSGSSVIIRKIQRPSANEAAFAFGLNGISGSDGEEDVEEESVEWAEVLASQWRLLEGLDI